MKQNNNYNIQLLIFFAFLCKILFAYFHSFIFSVPGLASDTYGFTLAAIELFLNKNFFYEDIINLNDYYQDKYHLLWLNNFFFGKTFKRTRD